MGGKSKAEPAQQVFRQFAWNLAGVVAGRKSGARPPVKPEGKR